MRALALAATATIAGAAMWLGYEQGPPTESILMVEDRRSIETPVAGRAEPGSPLPPTVEEADAATRPRAPVEAREGGDRAPVGPSAIVDDSKVAAVDASASSRAAEPMPTLDTAVGGLLARIENPDGTPLVGATVTVVPPDDAAPLATHTRPEGSAEFPALRAGNGYRVEVSFPGYATHRADGIAIPEGGTVTLPVRMSGEFQEILKVEAKRDFVDLEATATTTQFTDDFISDLPVPGRFYQNVVTLAPGAQDADGDGNPNVHGARDRVFQAQVSGRAKVAAPSAFALREEAPEHAFNTESYAHVEENGFHSVLDSPLSTFSIDVDTASYANVRRMLNAGQLPAPGAVRIEEMLNYFRYDDPYPSGDAPFAATIEVADAPWQPGHRLARIGIRGKEIARSSLAGTNLVFLIDVSGSMSPPNKLPLLKSALRLLVGQLDGGDRVAIVVYAGSSGLVLPPTSGADHAAILEALDRLESGGGTNGGAGLALAYRTAREGFIEGGVNRVVLATDGDFNLGTTNDSELLQLIEKDAKSGIFLTALGFGMGNFKDDRLELLADRGNGNYAYIDDLDEARKVLVEEIGGTLVTIAKDVKIQVEFNPAEVASYRLIGYENRLLAARDFNDDAKDAGEIGSGHTLTALYEIVPAAEREAGREVDDLRYQGRPQLSSEARSGELFTLKMRYKEPDGDRSRLLAVPVRDSGRTLAEASADFKLAAAIATFGMVLRDSDHRGEATLELARSLARDGQGRGDDYRRQLLELIDRAVALGGAERETGRR
jgi:Ca-activated chloride channel family protein